MKQLFRKHFHLIIFICFFSAYNSYASSQNINTTTVTLNEQGVTLVHILNKISSKTDFNITYGDFIANNNKKYNAVYKNVSLRLILKDLGKRAQFSFKVKGNEVLIGKALNDKLNVGQVQEKFTLTGSVKDKTGVSLPGASIVEKGTFNGVTADFDGNFSLNLSSDTRVIVISYVGYVTQEVAVNGQSDINIVLEEDSAKLSEVVVVGYGTQVDREVTGSISTIKNGSVGRIQSANFGESLVGVSPGVRVSQPTGQPGSTPSISIRGNGSITAGNEPLYVIDGFPVGSDALNTVNNSDIESITVLKDTSSVSIYGSRGSNGVILITTKRGKDGAPSISYNSYMGWQKVTKKVDVLSPEEYVELKLDASNNGWEYKGGNASDPNEIRPTFYQNSPYLFDKDSWVITDWQDEIFQTAPIYNNELSVSGGSDNLKYRLSGSILDQDGIIKTSNFKRYSIRSNINLKVTDKLRSIVDLNYTQSDEAIVDAEGTWGKSIIGSAIGLPGFFATQNEDGSYSDFQGFGYGVSAATNPMIYINEKSLEKEKSRILGKLALEYNPIENLLLKASFSLDNINTNNNYFAKSFERAFSSTYEASGSYFGVKSKNWLFEGTANYTVSLNKHHLNGLIGYTAQKQTEQVATIASNNFPNNLVTTLNAGVVTDAGTSIEEWSLLSYLARLNYSFDKKYFATFTVRKDGSSRFGSENKWGVFPSASVGWIASDEQFLKHVDAINFLKLRLSYGVSGNNAIPNYGSVGLLKGVDYVYGNNYTTGLVQSTNSNSELSWETSKQWDLGFELLLMNNRVSFTGDLYQKTNEDLLLEVNIPTIYGFNTALQNIGKVRNRGVELALSTVNTTGEFQWKTDVNFSLNRNKVLALGPSGDAIISTTYGGSPTHITQVGSSIGEYFGYIWEGVYNTKEEIEAHPSLPTDVPGSPIIKDVNGDGEISTEDRTVIGNNNPDFMYGFNNKFKYKNFDLNIFLQGVEGIEIMNIGKRQTMILTARTNQLGEARNRWRSPEDPGNGVVPSANIDIYGVRRDVSTFYVEDGSYFRVRDITLGYTLKKELINKLGVSQARLYLSANNPFIASKNTGYNPEVSTYHNSLTPGTEDYNYPTNKSYVFGMSLNF
ncbi:SusC/RagA family TonB-linked outer membrane protein [Algibacter pacificus]|uniref:SusC/RagA family TonB-linked outer membrane protein n=1 Tax=Algibacter pacificus TaxID=2599389 RepID=UPI0011C7666F|nr:TonB-dependent receptor [Algibacter pacificus]